MDLFDNINSYSVMDIFTILIVWFLSSAFKTHISVQIHDLRSL